MSDPGSKEREEELQELLEEVRRIEVQSRRLVTDVMSGGYCSVFRGSGIEFDEVREYVDGDDPRMVDWNVTARVGRPYIKKYVDERELTVLFLLDLSESMTGGFGVWSARQMAARICACLALSAVRNNDKVGLVAFSREVDKYVPPKKGLGHVLRIVRDCLALPGSSDKTDLGPALDFAASVLRRRSILFVVSDFLGGDWREPLTQCARRHDLTAVRILVPELTAPSEGLLRTRDPETDREALIDWRSETVRKVYQARVEAWRTRFETDLRRARVDLMDVPVPRIRDRDAVARPILRFFQMREKRGAKR